MAPYKAWLTVSTGRYTEIECNIAAIDEVNKQKNRNFNQIGIFINIIISKTPTVIKVYNNSDWCVIFDSKGCSRKEYMIAIVMISWNNKIPYTFKRKLSLPLINEVKEL